MEYFLGSLVTILTIFLLRRKVENNTKLIKSNNSIRYSQSYSYDLIKDLMPVALAKPLNTQASNFIKKNSIRIIFMDNNAYWIKDNAFYTAEMEDGMVVPETTKKVDIMGMSKIELDKMIFIVDKLTEGNKDDRRHSGN